MSNLTVVHKPRFQWALETVEVCKGVEVYNVIKLDLVTGGSEQTESYATKETAQKIIDIKNRFERTGV